MNATAIRVLLCACCLVWSLPAAQRPGAPAAAGAAASQATAPTNPTVAAIENARSAAELRADAAALPQLALPLKRGAPNPVATKPGRPVGPRGSVRDDVARCQAQRDADTRPDCTSAPPP